MTAAIRPPLRTPAHFRAPRQSRLSAAMQGLALAVLVLVCGLAVGVGFWTVVFSQVDARVAEVCAS